MNQAIDQEIKKWGSLRKSGVALVHKCILHLKSGQELSLVI